MRKLQLAGLSADMEATPSRLQEERPVLRIDETSKTLVAPPAGGLVTEVSPDRDELLALVCSSWEAFAGELGQPSLRFVVQGQAPGLEVLAFDEQAGRAVVVGSYGEKPLKGALVGSTAHKLLHLSERPVLVVRA